VDPLADKYFNFSAYNYVANNPIVAKDPDGKDIIFVVGDASYTYRQGNLYLINKQVWTPYTNGKYDFLSSNQQVVLEQFRYMENSGDKVFKGVLNTLILSRNKHEVLQGNNSTTGVVPFGQWSQEITISPATSLEHEVDHAVMNSKLEGKPRPDKNKNSDKQFDTKEERRVMTGSDMKTGNLNGEIPKGQYRKDHGKDNRSYKFIKVMSLISTSPLNPFKIYNPKHAKN